MNKKKKEKVVLSIRPENDTVWPILIGESTAQLIIETRDENREALEKRIKELERLSVLHRAEQARTELRMIDICSGATDWWAHRLDTSRDECDKLKEENEELKKRLRAEAVINN